MFNYGNGPATPWSSSPAWGNPVGMGGSYGFGMGFGNPNSFGGNAVPGYGSYFGTFPATNYAFNWTPMTDDEMEYFVEQSIDNDPTVPADANIGVEVENGVVTLTGTVTNKRVKHAAGDDAWWLPKVIDVHNQIEVQPRKSRSGAGEARTGGTPSARRGATR